MENIIKNRIKETLKFIETETNTEREDNLLRGEIAFLEHLLNYAPSCKQLPTEEHINTVAGKKALKYAYANESDYKDYVKAIEEGANFVKNYISKNKR